MDESGSSNQRGSRRTRRALAWLVLGLGAGLILTGCERKQPGAEPGAGAPSASAAAGAGSGLSANGKPLHREPADPCSALSAPTVEQFKLTKPSKRVVPGADGDPRTGIINYNFVKCSWSIDNPARGSNGRPNLIDYTISYVVIGKEYPTAEKTAESLYRYQKDQLLAASDKKKVERTETPTGYGDEAVYTYAVETGTLGPGGKSTLLVRTANAYVTISSSGADLKNDPAKPAANRLFVTAVPEDRLKPVVLATVKEVLALLG